MKSIKGFVLFEVMVSVAIVSAACLILARSLTESLKSARASQDYLPAALQLENVLWELDHRGGLIQNLPGDAAASGQADMKALRNANVSFNQKTAWKESLREVELILTWDSSARGKEKIQLSGYYQKK